uniref:PNPLA domain-containing protein n=1 Tax=viral metagenome TaxID=1070528 RepID=A0A6C0ABZ7_9ZZZZ
MKRKIEFNKTYFDIEFNIYTSKNNINNEDNKNSKLKKIDSLVFGGGGMKGINFAGVLKGLDNYGILKQIKNFLGVSAGSIVSFMYLAGYCTDDIIKICLKMDFSKLASPKIKNLYYGSLDDGSRMNKILERFLILKKIDPKINLKNFYNLTNKKFILTVYNSTKNKIEYIDYTNYPDLPVTTAIRMSSAIPVYYKPIKYNNEIFRDGGIGDNFPINYFKDFNTVIGFKFYAELIKDNPNDNLESSIINLINSIQLRELTSYIDKKKYYLDITSKVGVLEFGANYDIKLKTIRSSYLDTLKYLKLRFN